MKWKSKKMMTMIKFKMSKNKIKNKYKKNSEKNQGHKVKREVNLLDLNLS